MGNELINVSEKEKAIAEAKIDRKLLYGSLYEHLTAVVETKDFIDGEEVVKVVPNYPVQEKAQEKLLRVTGDIKPDGSVTKFQVNIGATPSEIKDLLAMAEDVRSQLRMLRASGRQTGDVVDAEIVR